MEVPAKMAPTAVGVAPSVDADAYELYWESLESDAPHICHEAVETEVTDAYDQFWRLAEI